MTNQTPQKPKVRNFVTKHTVFNDIIVHSEKQKMHTSRAHQKQEWKKEAMQ